MTRQFNVSYSVTNCCNCVNRVQAMFDRKCSLVPNEEGRELYAQNSYELTESCPNWDKTFENGNKHVNN